MAKSLQLRNIEAPWALLNELSGYHLTRNPDREVEDSEITAAAKSVAIDFVEGDEEREIDAETTQTITKSFQFGIVLHAIGADADIAAETLDVAYVEVHAKLRSDPSLQNHGGHCSWILPSAEIASGPASAAGEQLYVAKIVFWEIRYEHDEDDLTKIP